MLEEGKTATSGGESGVVSQDKQKFVCASKALAPFQFNDNFVK